MVNVADWLLAFRQRAANRPRYSVEGENVARAEGLLRQYLEETAHERRPWSLDPMNYPGGRAVLNSAPELQVSVIHAVVSLQSQRLDAGTYGHDVDDRLDGIASRLLRRHLPYTVEDLLQLIDFPARTGYLWLPHQGFLRSVQRYSAQHGVDPVLRDALQRLRETWKRRGRYAEDRKLAALLDQILGETKSPQSLVERGDGWGELAGGSLAAMDQAERAEWETLLIHLQSAGGTKPSARWLTETRRRVADLGERTLRERTSEWFGLLDGANRGVSAGIGRPTGLTERNGDLLKGLAWCCSLSEDADDARMLGDAALACYKKLGFGPRSPKVGNACIVALGAMPGLHGIAQLQRLQQRIKYPSAQKIIASAFEAAARRAGLSRDDLEELAAPTFDLTNGRMSAELAGCTAEIVAGGPHRVDLRWTGPDGKPRRSEPAQVKQTCPGELRALKRTVEEIRKALTAQRDRVERLLASERSWPLAEWHERYLDHPLVSVLARRLIWHFQAGERAATGTWLDGALVDADDRPLKWLSDETRVRLWHPIGVDPTAVLAWREWLERHAVTQPFKQAHREIYVITDAELETDTYSNRFAAHILRQHQFRELCLQRGWPYRLQGRFDGHNVPTLALPRWGLKAEFWVEPVFVPEDEQGTGVSRYVSTDQVRFVPLGGGNPLRLADVPALVFTEVMRDVDLFVGVCSIGNDPAWADRGLAEYDAYWSSYAFGDLSASARTRRAVLERLLPRLAIAPRCSLTDRFLVVRGDLRTYRIHLGSGNIQMEPNAQYLCIVPDHTRAAETRGENLFLPFEGDNLLAVILSKAFLLAEDRKIKDPTITRQIGTRA